MNFKNMNHNKLLTTDDFICSNCNWNKECEDFVNEQITLEYWASLQYHALSSYFSSRSVAMENIAKFFNKCSLEEREHADKLIMYQNKRGGTVVIGDIKNINNNFYNSKIEMSNLLQAFNFALEMEEKVYFSLLKLNELAEKHKDYALSDFITSEYLKEQIDAINELSLYVSQLTNIGNDTSNLWLFNKDFKTS